MKKYCKNCHYLTFGDWCFRYDTDELVKPKRIVDTRAEIAKGKNLSDKEKFWCVGSEFGELNCKNDCPYYKRKWWKIWVK